MIVTLAGHVDHGKTSLVQRLTGINTDRLSEERRRGLTIDLGFAYLSPDSDDNQTSPLGFVDVPGHHRFIHNMVAGIAAEQHALLVIAADDGPMPQSREHLDIMQLLGLRDGTVVITKCDRVTPDRLELVRAEIDALLANSFLESAPRFLTSAETGAGIDDLLAHLLEHHRQHRIEAAARRFRLAIDRAFTLQGAGVVVTGTVHAGTIHVDDELVVFPEHVPVRVRSIHAQNQPATIARVGDRCAVNITGVDREQVRRGQWLGSAPARGHRSVTIRLTVLADFPRAVRHWTPVHIYHATSHTTGRLALLRSGSLQPGEEALCELVSDEVLLARHGDRLVLRDQSLDRTLGGGPVTSTVLTAGRRRDPGNLAVQNAYDTDDPSRCLDRLLRLGPVSVPEFDACWDLSDDAWQAVKNQIGFKELDDFAIAESTWQQWSAAAFEEAQKRLEAEATLTGLKANEFATTVPEGFRQTLRSELVTQGKLTLKGNLYGLPSHEVALSDSESRLLQRLERQLNQDQPPSLGDISKAMKLPLSQLHKDVQPLLAKGKLVRINDRRLFLPDQVPPLAELARTLSEQGPFSVRQFRDACGMGRNVVIEVLEYFDSRGYTRRDGDTRNVVGDLDRLNL